VLSTEFLRFYQNVKNLRSSKITIFLKTSVFTAGRRLGFGPSSGVSRVMRLLMRLLMIALSSVRTWHLQRNRLFHGPQTCIFSFNNCCMRQLTKKFKVLIPVVQRVDNAIHRINHYPVHSMVCFDNTSTREWFICVRSSVWTTRASVVRFSFSDVSNVKNE